MWQQAPAQYFTNIHFAIGMLLFSLGKFCGLFGGYPISICCCFRAEDRERECDKSMVNDSKKLERMIGKNELPLSAVNIKKNGSAEQTGYAFTFVALLWWARQCHSNFL